MLSKAYAVFDCLKTWIVILNPTQGMYVRT